MSDNDWMQRGCRCETPCGFPPPKTGECVYWQAKTRGPITLREGCSCVSVGSKTFHDRAGICLRCEVRPENPQNPPDDGQAVYVGTAP